MPSKKQTVSGSKPATKKKAAPKKVKEVPADDKLRSFTIVKIIEKKSGTVSNDVGGRYMSKRPKSVSMKCFSQYSKSHDGFKGALQIYLRETTRGENGGFFVYEVRRKTLDEPLVVKREGKDIVYKYKMESESMKEERKKFTSLMLEAKAKPAAEKKKKSPKKVAAKKSPKKASASKQKSASK